MRRCTFKNKTAVSKGVKMITQYHFFKKYFLIYNLWHKQNLGGVEV